jgi:hypothetical protein
MPNRRGFRSFYGGLYVQKIGRGQIKVLISNLDAGLTSTDFTVSATGIRINATGTDGDHVMLVSPKAKEYYNVSGVQVYSCELLMTRGYDINYVEDILTTGYIDLAAPDLGSTESVTPPWERVHYPDSVRLLACPRG